MTERHLTLVELCNIMIQMQNGGNSDAALAMAEALLQQRDVPVVLQARCHGIFVANATGLRSQVFHARQILSLLDQDLEQVPHELRGAYPLADRDNVVAVIQDAEAQLAELENKARAGTGGDGAAKEKEQDANETKGDQPQDAAGKAMNGNKPPPQNSASSVSEKVSTSDGHTSTNTSDQ